VQWKMQERVNNMASRKPLSIEHDFRTGRVYIGTKKSNGVYVSDWCVDKIEVTEKLDQIIIDKYFGNVPKTEHPGGSCAFSRIAILDPRIGPKVYRVTIEEISDTPPKTSLTQSIEKLRHDAEMLREEYIPSFGPAEDESLTEAIMNGGEM